MITVKRLLLSPFALLGTVVLLASCSSLQLISEMSKPEVAATGQQLPQYGRHYKIGLPYVIKGRRYFPEVDYNYTEVGLASWYGKQFHGRETANGATFNMHAVSAAHRTLPLPSLIQVENLDNGRKLVVLVNDRGPFHGNRILDMSMRGAELLGFKNKGLARVRVTILPEESRLLAAQMQSGRPPASVVALQQQVKEQSRPAPVRNDTDSTLVSLKPVRDGTAVRVPEVVKAPLRHLKQTQSTDALIPPVAGTYVQIATLRQYNTALAVKRQITAFSTSIGLTKMNEFGMAMQYRVLVGPFDSTSEAANAKEKLQKLQFPNAHIISWQL